MIAGTQMVCKKDKKESKEKRDIWMTTKNKRTNYLTRKGQKATPAQRLELESLKVELRDYKQALEFG